MKENFKKFLWCLPYAFPFVFATVFMYSPFEGFDTIVYITMVCLPLIYGVLGKLYPVVIGNLASGFITTSLLFGNVVNVEAKYSDPFTPAAYAFFMSVMMFVLQISLAGIANKIFKDRSFGKTVRKALIAVAAVVPAVLSIILAASVTYVYSDFNKNGFNDKYSYGVVEHYSEKLYFSDVEAVYDSESDSDSLGDSSNTEYYNDYMIFCTAYKEKQNDDIYIGIYQQVFFNPYSNEYLSFSTLPQKAEGKNGEELVLVPVLQDDGTHKMESGCFVNDSKSFNYYIYDADGNRLTVNDIEKYFPIDISIDAQGTYVNRVEVF